MGRAGLNGRWFTITEDQRSWADPLQGLDNVSRTGQPTREDAAARVEEIMRPRGRRTRRGKLGASPTSTPRWSRLLGYS